jgi:hypothetical protein
MGIPRKRKIPRLKSRTVMDYFEPLSLPLIVSVTMRHKQHRITRLQPMGILA